MPSESPKSLLELECPGCGTRFRLKFRKTRRKPVPCPKCQTPIPVQQKPADGVRAMGLSEVFGRPAEAPVPAAEPVEMVPEPPPRRTFRDVTSISFDGAKSDSTREVPIVEKDATVPVQIPSGAELPENGFGRQDTREKSSLIEDTEMPESAVLRKRETQAASTPRVSRAPENRSRPFTQLPSPDINEERPPVIQEPTVETPIQAETLLPDDVTAEVPKSVVEQARRLAATRWSESQVRDALNNGIRARVGEDVFGPLDRPGLKLLLRSEVYLDAIELEFDETWLSMSRHPVLMQLKAELQAEALTALEHVVVATATDERERAPETAAPPSEPHESEPLLDLADFFDPGEPVSELSVVSEPSEAPERVALPDESDALDSLDVPDESEPGPPPIPTEKPEPAEPDLPVANIDVPEFSEMVVTDIAAARDMPSNRIATPLVIVSFIAVSLALVWFVNEYIHRPEPIPIQHPPPKEALRAAFATNSRARSMANAVNALRQEPTETLRLRVEKSLRRADYGAALELVSELHRREPESEAVVVLQVRALMGARQWNEARSVLINAFTRAPSPELRALFAETVQGDPGLRDITRTIAVDEPADAIKSLGGGRSVSMKLKRDGKNVFAFKPAQIEWEQGWRSEVAAWRLCNIIACGFNIPVSQSARVSREDFEALYPMDSLKQRNYAKRFEELVWANEPGPDGIEREYLHGVLKAWVPHFTDWPIEYTHVWEPWLNVDSDPVVLDTPFNAAIRPLALYKDGEYLRNIKREKGEATTRSISRQLSNVLVFDYLTNNWDRFSALEDYYGVNNQFADGIFVSIDNGACFHLQSSIRVDARFEPVERMSRTMVASIRLLDRRWLDGLLFPNASSMERERLDVFWKRRDQFLARVDGLVAKHGEDAVLVFD